MGTLIALAPIPPLLLVVAACWIAANRTPAPQRRAWEYVGAGFVLWAGGFCARIGYQLIVHAEPPLPSAANLLLLAGYPVLIAGLLGFSRGPTGRLSQLLLGLDIALTTAAAGVFVWHAVLGAQIARVAYDLTLLAWTLAVDLGPLALAGALIASFLRTSTSTARLPAALAAAGIAGHTITDWVQVYLRSGGAAPIALPVEIGWIVSDLFVALGAILQARAPAAAESPFRSKPVARMLSLIQVTLPFVGLLMVAGLLVYDNRLPAAERDPSIAWGLALTTVLLTVRQAVAGSEQVRLYALGAAHEAQLDGLVKQLLRTQEDERRVIAYDLHDGLTQLIVSANLHLETLSGMPDANSPQARAELGKALERVKGAIDEARRVTSTLRPSTLDDLGLVATLRRYVDELAREAHWQVEFEEDGLQGVRLDPSIEATVFRIAQEALTNAHKYAAATRVRVALRCRGRTLSLEIRDWGRGFDTQDQGAAPGRERVGLVGIQERSRMLGGMCAIESAPGEGTSLRVEIPIRAGG